METKPLLYGIIGFFLGGLLVSVAATTFDNPAAREEHATSALQSKSGDDFDKAFMAEMIKHHEAALEMAQLADTQAGHTEIKTLSKNILEAQSKEIDMMQTWQTDWGYRNVPRTHSSHPATE